MSCQYCGFMRDCHLQETKLDDKLFETFKIKLMNFPFVEQLDVDVPDEPINLRLRY